MDKLSIDDFLRRTTLRQIEIVVTLDIQGSMTKTAAELGMSIANVSRTAKRFETNVGMKIFAGETRRWIILAEGRELIAKLHPLLHEINALKQRLESAQDT